MHPILNYEQVKWILKSGDGIQVIQTEYNGKQWESTELACVGSLKENLYVVERKGQTTKTAWTDALVSGS
jgi:hypothetical protein